MKLFALSLLMLSALVTVADAQIVPPPVTPPMPGLVLLDSGYGKGSSIGSSPNPWSVVEAECAADCEFRINADLILIAAQGWRVYIVESNLPIERTHDTPTQRRCRKPYYIWGVK